MKEERESINVGAKLISHAEWQNMNGNKELVRGSPESTAQCHKCCLRKRVLKKACIDHVFSLSTAQNMLVASHSAFNGTVSCSEHLRAFHSKPKEARLN